MTRAKLRAELDEAFTYWAQIEEKIKDAEYLSQGVIVPAINELRYAGRRLLLVANDLSATSPSEEKLNQLREEFVIAKQYLQNADHDVADGILTYFNRLREYADLEIGHESVARYYEDYANFKKRLDQAIAEAREARKDLTTRAERYIAIHEKFIDGFRDDHDQIKQAIAKARRDVLVESRGRDVEATTQLITRWGKWLLAAIAFVGTVSTLVANDPDELAESFGKWRVTIINTFQSDASENSE